jgi:hypothetical protein
MTDTTRIRPDEDIPSLEPWVLTLFSVFIPIALGFAFPRFIWPFISLSVGIFALSMVMLARQERAKKRAAPVPRTR